MKIVGKIILGIVSVLLFTILLLLATVRFELLNKSFLFPSLERHIIYSQLPTLLATSLPSDPNLSSEEKLAYIKLAINISPETFKQTVENNLEQVLDYLNGSANNIVLSASLNGDLFQNINIHWSLSQLPDKNLLEKIKLLNGIGNILIIVSIIIFSILTILFFISKKFVLLAGGIWITVVSLITKLFLLIIGKQLVNGPEPSQKLLALLSTSLFADITTTWLVIGAILVLLGVAFHTHHKNLKI